MALCGISCLRVCRLHFVPRIIQSHSSINWLLTNQLSSKERSFSTSKLTNQECGYKLKNNVKDCYSLLNVEEGCSEGELREAYLRLAKMYHPDSGTTTADKAKFTQLQDAYQTIKLHRESPESVEEEEEEGIDIKHTAPQHRQYLTFEGVGYGTPGQRLKQYQQYKIRRATEKVYDHRVLKWANQTETAVVVKVKNEARKAKISNAIDRMVEDLIQEAMQNGEFDNLPGSGKPLDFAARNPMVDTMTHNLNKILINNGYTPEWIVLEKEIRDQMKEARGKLAVEVKRSGLPPYATDDAERRWTENLNIFRDKVDNINSMIDKFNMLVPIMEKQMIPFNKNREVERVKTRYVEYASYVTNTAGHMEREHKFIPYKEEKLSWRTVLKNIKESFR